MNAPQDDSNDLAQRAQAPARIRRGRGTKFAGSTGSLAVPGAPDLIVPMAEFPA